MPQGGLGMQELSTGLPAGQRFTERFDVPEPFRIDSADRDKQEESIVFMFSLDGVSWSKRPGESAVRRDPMG
jgi:hypothetical protein